MGLAVEAKVSPNSEVRETRQLLTAAREGGVGAWANVVTVVMGWKAGSRMQSEAGRLVGTHELLIVWIDFLGLQ